jgi:hypothetical protein
MDVPPSADLFLDETSFFHSFQLSPLEPFEGFDSELSLH